MSPENQKGEGDV